MERKLRSRKALQQVVLDLKNESLKNQVFTLLDNPVDKTLLKIFEEANDTFTLEKRIVQEHIAHFVFKYLVMNNKQLNQSGGIRKAIALAGDDPEFAAASYIRRGLIDHVDLFDRVEYRIAEVHRRKRYIAKLWNDVALPFWRGTPKSLAAYYQDYTSTPSRSDEYVGFILDHCGDFGDINRTTDFILSKVPKDSLFFVEVTLLDARLCNPTVCAIELERALSEEGFRIQAKDMFQYAGGKKRHKSMPMTSLIWVYGHQSLDTGSYLVGRGKYSSLIEKHNVLKDCILSQIKKEKGDIKTENLTNRIAIGKKQVYDMLKVLAKEGRIYKQDGNWHIVKKERIKK
jgi:hypothetical protein